MAIEAGEMFRHFRVVEKIGEGGMGVVYRARDESLGRDVALKFLTRVTDRDAGLARRMRREARSLAALNHPNIVAIHEIGDVDGVPFLVLEWIDGKALDDASWKRPMAVADFLRIARPVAEALAEAHEHGIVHRDVKPANVLVTQTGRAKLVDFGLAKPHGGGDDVTRTDGTVGTVAYMSPEQARGDDIGPASDVFSFGVLAYELLTGERPFQGRAPGSVILAILSGEHQPLPSRRPDLPAGLAELVERCLASEPRSRFADGRAVSQALLGVETPPAGDSDGPPPAATTRPAPAPAPGSEQITQRAQTLQRKTSDPPAQQQDIRFCTTADGVSIAYSVIGSGPLLVRVLGHFTHLEMEWQWPDLRRFWERLAEHHTVVRYDGRGIGLSESFDGEFTEETRQLDLDAVLDAAAADPVILLGISEGGWTAARYCVDHPHRISHLVLYGAYCRGAQARPLYDPEEDAALMTLMRKGWGADTPAFRQIFTSQFFREDADPRLLAHFNEMQRASADPDTAARYHESCHQRGDGRDLYCRVSKPTLVVHSQGDRTCSADESRLLASVIPGARLVILPDDIHYFPTDRETVERLATTIQRFLLDSDAAVADG